VWDFQIESTEEPLTAHGGLTLLAEYNQGLGGRQLSDRYLQTPGRNRGSAPSAFGESLVLRLPAGGPGLEDLRELEQEAARIGVGKGFPIRTRWERGSAGWAIPSKRGSRDWGQCGTSSTIACYGTMASPSTPGMPSKRRSERQLGPIQE